MILINLIRSIFTDKKIIEELSFLKSFPVFKDLTHTELSRIYNIMFLKEYLADEIIFEAKKTGKAIFFIYSGEVLIYNESQKTGKKHVIATLNEGSFFGEMALLEDLPRTATAKTTRQSKLYLIYKSNFDALLENYPKIGIKIIKNLLKIVSFRLRELTDSPHIE